MSAIATATKQSPEDRTIFLRSLCKDDEELFREISEQLKWQEEMGGFLLKPLATLGSFDRPFEIGQIVSGRFSIVREIGEGGMGIVYEAFDLKRNSRIALKLAKAGFKRLLTPELAGALKVRHPNVCLVNEIHSASSLQGEIDFLTMEFLEGETLARRLSRDGAIPPAQALDIARQLCEGLAEAHRSDVLHRDLKTSNVILSQTADGKPRAVITDFGLSGGMSSANVALAGTPSYIAPELWKGEPPSQASDIYALGVILYEILTARRPFDSLSPDQMPSHAAGEKVPLPPGKIVKGLDPRWDAAIMPCLSANALLRPSEPRKIISTLDRKARSKTLYAAIAAMMVASLIPGVRNLVLQPFSSPHVRLAILPFPIPSDVRDQIGGSLEDVIDRLRRRKSGGAPVVLVTPSEAASNGVKTAADAGSILHATHALEGRVTHDGAYLVVDADVVDIRTQARLRHLSARYLRTNAGDIPKALAGSVSLALRLEGEAPKETLSPAASGPYLRALYFLRRDTRSFDDASPLLQEASRTDPHSPLPLAGLTEAWLQKYKITREPLWLTEAQRAYASAEALDPDSVRVRLVGGMLNEASGRYEKALDDYNRVLEIDPQNIQALQGTASIYDSIDSPDKAIAAYQKAIEIQPGYYATYQMLGVYYYYRGMYREATTQFQNAIDRAPGLVKAYTNLAAALSDQGNDSDAERALMASLKLRRTASAFNSMGAIRTYQERHEEATHYYRQALDLDPRNYIFLMNLGDSYRRTGQLSKAAEAYREAMELATRALADNPNRGYTRAFVGYFAARLGDQIRARDEINQALQSSPSDQQLLRQSVLTYEVLGDRERALSVLRGATTEMLNELGRQPDLKSLQSDPRFVVLKQSSRSAQSKKAAEQGRK